MTNPEHEELMKLADQLMAQDYGNVSDVDVMGEHFALLAKAATALRRLASSDGGVKGEPEPVAWPANLNPRTLDLVQRFALALAKKLRLAEEKYGHADGWSRDDWESECRDHLYQHLEKGDPRDVAAYCAFMWHHGWITYRPEITAPPADAGMREALGAELSEIFERFLSAHDGDKAHLADVLREWLWDNKAGLVSALTAPSATTKSDGGEPTDAQRQEALRLLKAEDDRQSKLHDLLETIREQIRIGVEPEHRPEGLFNNIQNAVYAMRGRTLLMNDAAITCVLYTDSSSTRSEVTVEELARFINGYTGNDENGNRCARALLDQFEIRRK